MNTYVVLMFILTIISIHFQYTISYTELDDLDPWQKYPNYDYPINYIRRYSDYHKRGLRNMRMGKRSMYERIKSIPTE
ncbi:unnamed protein product [Schistosoma rodhaini]|uniref:Hypotheticial protein n=1 Tax=Schistosoma mansoni TaxID=6183 RepID=G4LXS5_SCHMA|nr:hypothetical protein Smp_150650 [Schistosoma mansoni]CAH8577235.1 unnamed protein product [Schistosoma rodhaini]|eukprot:XP_018646064.1 hypothetical protein Smp_150650 [Schistosoma mansoni]